MNKKGQIVIILLLVMLVALTIALAIAQRSLTNISTSNKSEQSSRAFSAAEAGLEQALKGGSTGTLSFGNESSAIIATSNKLPFPGSPEQSVEYPPVGKDTVAQFWLIDPYQDSNFTSSSGPATYYPKNTSFVIYYGSPTSYTQGTEPAIEVNLIVYDSAKGYLSFKSYYDCNTTRAANNHFLAPDNCNKFGLTGITTSEGPSRVFVAKATVSPPGSEASATPVLVRVRVLYTDVSQPIAFAPTGSATLPPQVTIFTSTGSSGQTERKLRVFRSPYIAPFFFDYSIFSTTDIKKCNNC